MAVTDRKSYTLGVPGVKIISATLAELNAAVGHVNAGELGFVNAAAGADGGLYIKATEKATSFTKICEVGAEVNP